MTHDEGSHRWECMEPGCACEEFVIGGMTEEELRADTEREMPAVRLSDTPKTDRDKDSE